MDPTMIQLYPHITASTAAEEFERGDLIRNNRQFSFDEQQEWEDKVDRSRVVDWKSVPRSVFSDTVASWYAEDLEFPECDQCTTASALLRRCSLCRQARYCDTEW